MQGDFVRFVDVGVDWLTITCDEPIKRTRLEILVQRITHQQQQIGEEIKPWSMYGFEGLSCDGLQYGWRDESMIVRMSSVTAYENWRRFGALSTNCSRLDLQCTVEYSSVPGAITKKHMRQMSRWRKERKSAPALSIFHEVDGPSTVYVGKRVSDRFGRIYNKEAESKLEHYRNCVRYEIELKNKAASIELDGLLRVKDEAPIVIAKVWTYFRDRGAVLPWPLSTQLQIVVPRKRSNALKRLAWLAESVKSPVQDLIAAGYYEDVLKALGLDEHLQTHSVERGSFQSESMEV